MNVLLMDDDIFMLSMLRGALVRWGFTVDAYSNPNHCPAFCSEACPCSMYKDGCPDMILTDVNMPQVNGIKFIEELKRKGCKCPKIGMMSGDWSDSNLLKATRMGVTIFSKPFDLPRLCSWVSEDKILHVA
jgi:DNA-binding response OmpR family regulator